RESRATVLRGLRLSEIEKIAANLDVSVECPLGKHERPLDRGATRDARIDDDEPALRCGAGWAPDQHEGAAGRVRDAAEFALDPHAEIDRGDACRAGRVGG